MKKLCLKDDVLDLLAKGEKLAHEKIGSSPMLECILGHFGQLREILELALAKQLEVALVTHRLIMAILKAGKAGFQSELARQEAVTRAKICQILNPFRNLDED